jgi:hypothetical protein
MGVGACSLIGFLFLPAESYVDHFLIRYLLLSLLLPVGLGCLLIQTRRVRMAAVALIIWVGANFSQSATLWAHLLRHPPPDPYADVAQTLREMDIRVALARYSDAYYLTFLLEEEIIVTTPVAARIPEYVELWKRSAGEGRAHILRGDFTCPQGVRVHEWIICPEPQRPR